MISLSVDPPEWFRDGQLDRAGPEVPLSRPIAVATVGSIRAADAVLRAADRVGVCAFRDAKGGAFLSWKDVCKQGLGLGVRVPFGFTQRIDPG